MTAVTNDTHLYIAGDWRSGEGHEWIDVFDPATCAQVGRVAKAGDGDIAQAVTAAVEGFRDWSMMAAHRRARIIRDAGRLLTSRAEEIARLICLEQGKPLRQAIAECRSVADVLEWYADEARRQDGRVIPARRQSMLQFTTRCPVGPVAAFTPWNFPVNPAVRKLGPALAAGCSVILKAPEETPAAPAALVGCFLDAGLPAKAITLLFGDPPQISSALIAHPDVAKISFTGSTTVGKQLAAAAGRHMKRSTMELGGHAPVIVASDADIDHMVKLLTGAKFLNAGQVCIAPTRVLAHRDVSAALTDRLARAAERLRIGPGTEADTTMGPLVSRRRLEAVAELVTDALDSGASLITGGHRVADDGHFYAPTILGEVPVTARVMNEEPFGPVLAVNSFDTLDAAIAEANRLRYGLAAYGFSQDALTIHRIRSEVAAGMISINHVGLGDAETPFGGINDSGYGSEGGSEAMEGYLYSKFHSVVH